jgi:hypothetical protein
LAGLTTATPRPVLAAPTIVVAAPRIVSIEECIATVSVAVTLSGITRGVRYEVFGDIVEADAPGGDDDFCCPLDPQPTPVDAESTSTVLLTQQAMAPVLGLMRGLGAASDETSRPERVQLFARVWARDLMTGDRFGPWESPQLSAAPNPRLVWTPRKGLPGSELMPPRGGTSFAGSDSLGLPMPPHACRP